MVHKNRNNDKINNKMNKKTKTKIILNKNNP